MGRIDRYVLSQLLAVFGLASLVLVLVAWINRAVGLFDRVVADGQTAWAFLELTALALPSLVRIALPLAAFVAALYALSRLRGESELAVLQAAGVSPWRLARPVLAFGLLVAALVTALTSALVPASLARLALRQAELAQVASGRLLREGEFVAPADGLTLFVAAIDDDGTMRDLLLSDTRREGERSLTTAASAHLVPTDAGLRLVLLDGQTQRLADGRLAVTTFADLAYDLDPGATAAGPRRTDLRQVSTPALLRADAALVAATGEDAARLRAEAHGRLAEALLAPVAVLVALGALLSGAHSRLGAWRQVLLAIGVVVLLRLVDQAAGQALDREPSRWPLAYAATLAGAGAATLLLAHAARPWRPFARGPA